MEMRCSWECLLGPAPALPGESLTINPEQLSLEPHSPECPAIILTRQQAFPAPCLCRVWEFGLPQFLFSKPQQGAGRTRRGICFPDRQKLSPGEGFELCVWVRVLNWPRWLSMVCISSLRAAAQQPGMTACCPTLPLSLCHQPSLPGTLCRVLMVIKGSNDLYLGSTWAGPSNPQ